MATTLQKTICAVNSSLPKRKATTLANNAMMTQTTRTDKYTTICSKYLVFILYCRIKFYHFQYLFE